MSRPRRLAGTRHAAPAPSCRCRAGRRTRGASSLMSIVVLAIVAVALLGIMAYYLNSVAGAGRNRDSGTASAAVERKLAELRGLSYEALQAGYPHGTPVYFDVAGLAPVPPAPRPGWVTVDFSHPVQVRVVIRAKWKGAHGDAMIPAVDCTFVPR